MKQGCIQYSCSKRFGRKEDWRNTTPHSSQSGAVDSQSEDVMLQVKGFTNRLQHKGLRERVGRIIICLQLAKDIDKNASIKHGLTIHLSDDVKNLLKCQALHDQIKLINLGLFRLNILYIQITV